MNAWSDSWVPPSRAGFVWTPGYSAYGYYHPGSWRPSAAPPRQGGVEWSWVPGFWSDSFYVEGYWRRAQRAGDRMVWIDGRYTVDERYIPGHWRPMEAPAPGYVWEPGFFDGARWIEGFWRPASLAGYSWEPATYLPDGTYFAGTWLPLTERPGHTWSRGWFDGEAWVSGYWVLNDRVVEPVAASAAPTTQTETDSLPLAIPATFR